LETRLNLNKVKDAKAALREPKARDQMYSLSGTPSLEAKTHKHEIEALMTSKATTSKKLIEHFLIQ